MRPPEPSSLMKGGGHETTASYERKVQDIMGVCVKGI